MFSLFFTDFVIMIYYVVTLLWTRIHVKLGECVLACAILQRRWYSFIDFEYAGYNSRGFDLGNHFNEYAGFDVDWSLFPNEERMQWFISHYLESITVWDCVYSFGCSLSWSTSHWKGSDPPLPRGFGLFSGNILPSGCQQYTPTKQLVWTSFLPPKTSQ